MIRVRQVKVPLDDKDNLKEYISKKLKTKILDFKIIKESLDARKKPELYLIYEVDVKVENEKKILKNNKYIDIFESQKEEFIFKVTGTESLKTCPIIIGAGPAGLFCGYFLAKYGYRPIILEQGEKIEDRVKTVEEFWKTNKLNKYSNVQFGEGGAGTFSDGKLNTLVKDKEHIGKKVFEIFVENGAPEEIMYLNKPHIGTDILRTVVVNMRKKIINMGGEFRYNSCVTDLFIENNKVNGVVVNNSEKIKSDIVVLATGHSSRDIFNKLYEKNVVMESKPFAVGVRIIHPQEMINLSQYGKKHHPYLKSASYKLTYTTKEKRGVYSFCMCPGGYVVNASSENNGLVVNGMSNYNRDSKCANSAIVVTVSKKDYGEGILDGIKFQQELERKAYELAGGIIPVQLYKDFKLNRVSNSYGEFLPEVKGNYNLANLNELFPKYISDSLKEGIEYFESKIKGFSRDDAILLGVESRTSSPVRILRNEEGISSVDGLYPCGEGAGYAGGITTSAIDGVKIAKLIAQKFKKENK